MGSGKHAIALASVLLLMAGCGSRAASGDVASANHSSTAPTVDAAEQSRRWAECMRGAGIVLAQDADGGPVVDKDKNAIEKLNAAYETCRALAPVVDSTGKPPTAQELDKLRQHAACVRQHGVAEYPDPDPVTGGAAAAEVLSKRDKYDPQVKAALQACQALLGGSDKGVAGG
jgi:hypothetical protein